MDTQNKKLVIFDFDGVLVNTLEFYYQMHKKVNETLTWEKFKDFSLGNVWANLERVVEKESFTIPHDYREQYEEKIQALTIHDVLNKTIEILSPDYLLAIVSSSSDRAIKNFLVKEKIDKYFCEISGSDIHRSKVLKINNILLKHKIIPENAVFVTDSLGDILEGNECRIKSIGVTWGIHDAEILKKGNPVSIIDDPKDLLDAVKNACPVGDF